MFNRSTYENSRPDGIAVLEIVNGVKPAEKQIRLFVPLKRTELKGEVNGPLDSLHLTQTYGYTREQCELVLEAVYRFPLPGDAAVTGVHVRFGDVEISAELKERQKAEADYEAAKKEGRQAALATRESPDVFTLQVAGIQPGQDVAVETTYVQLARPEGPGWSLRIPLTTVPRYVRDDDIASREAQGQPLLVLRDPGHRFSLDVTLRGVGAVESPTHALDVTPDGDVGDASRVRLHDGEVLPDRDCVLAWKPAQESDRPSLQVLLHDDPDSGRVYFLALLAPPAVQVSGPGVPREVVLLVDHSGSMEGAKWEAADWAVKRFLQELAEGDAFALGLFHTSTSWFSKKPVKAGPKAVARAARFLEERKDSGGTNLGVALEQALRLERTKGGYARNVLIATDADVYDLGRILRLATQESNLADRRRISVLCVDAAPNSFLAKELAQRGGGVAKFLTSAPEEEDISTVLDQVLADWAQPVLYGAVLSVNRAGVQAAGRAVLGDGGAGKSLIDLGDLPTGRPVWVAGRLPRGDASVLEFQVAAAGTPDVATLRLDLGQEAVARPALKALFGARRVQGLEFLIQSRYSEEDLNDQLERLGYDPVQLPAGRPGEAPSVYAENALAARREALRGLLVAEAMHYGLACSETAFVAVRTEAGQQVQGSVAVANALAAGWSDAFVALRSATLGLAAGGPVAGRYLPTGAAAPSSIFARLWPFRRRQAGRPDAARPPGRAQSSAPVEQAAAGVLFSGVPLFTDGEAVLFDSSRDQDAGKLPETATINRLEVRFPGGAPAPEGHDPGLALLIFVDDPSSPRARVRLADVASQGGERPLNLLKSAGEVVRIVLLDPAGAWTRGATQIEVVLSWQA